jgi:ABC-type multidrug transport system ATPase subunit
MAKSFAMLEIRDLEVSYPSGKKALDRVSLSLTTGVFGLLGPNGAGKSTLLRVVASVQKPGAGSVCMNGARVSDSPQAWRRNVGYLPQDFGLPEGLTVIEWLEYVGTIKGTLQSRARRDRAMELLSRLNLWSNRDQRIGTLSGGMRQRLGLAQALWGDPGLLILDEPTTGLDVEERGRLLDLLAEVGERATVILSTHGVADIQDVCSRIGVLADGRLKFEGTQEQAQEFVLGSVWQAEIERTQKESMLSRFPNARIDWQQGGMRARVISADSPGEAFARVRETMTDAYYHLVHLARLEAR